MASHSLATASVQWSQLRLTVALMVSKTSTGFSCSQKRSTVQPDASRYSFVRTSRRQLAAIFSGPEGGVCLRWAVVIGAAVPEAAIDEHRHAGADEHQVCA